MDRTVLDGCKYLISSPFHPGGSWFGKCLYTGRAKVKYYAPSEQYISNHVGFFRALVSRYRTVRSVTTSLAAPTSAEDQMVQSCPEASPMKRHQAQLGASF